MAITITALTSGYETTTHPSVTASISPASGSVVYAYVGIALAGGSFSHGSDSLSGSGAGLTWTTIGTVSNVGGDRRRLFLMRGTGTPSSGAVTWTFTPGGGETWTETAWSIVQIEGLDGTTPNGTVYTNFTSGATSLSVTVSDVPDSGDFVLAGFSIESNSTSPTRNSELDTTIHSLDGGSDMRALFTAYDSVPDSTPAPGITWTGTNSAYGIAVVLNVAAGASATSFPFGSSFARARSILMH